MTIWLTNRVKLGVFLGIFLLLAVVARQVTGLPPSLHFDSEKLLIRTQGAVYPFTVELATSPDQQRQGLMFRESLGKDQGMLFMKEAEIPAAMWMKNTLIPLDMLFIDNSGHIVYIAERATPQSTDLITAGRPVRAILELAGGVAAEKQIHVGDQIISERFTP